jgi:putative MATE family efflux protein
MSEEKNSRIGQDFTLSSLLKFALPGLLTSLSSRLFETLDDALFVSRFVGQNALAGIKILMPVDGLILAMTHIFGLGACTYAATEMGRGNKEEAKRIFTRMILMAIGFGIAFAALVITFDDQILSFLGAERDIMQYTETYVAITFVTLPFKLASMCFSSFYSAAGKPSMGLFNSILSGVINVITDYITIVVLGMGVAGAAIATSLGFIANFIVGIIFYMRGKNDIGFIRPQRGYWKTLLESTHYSLSQVTNSLTMSMTAFVVNRTILFYLGSDGIAARSIVNDIRMILNSAFVGFATTVGPIIAYNYGARRVKMLKKILYNNLKIWFFGCTAMIIIGQCLKRPLVGLFMNPETFTQSFYDMTYFGLTIELFAPIFTAGCIMANRMFVALRAQKISTFLSLTRNFVFRMTTTLLIPKLFGANSIWFCFPVSEALSFTLYAIAIIMNADNYGYGRSGIAYLIDTRDDEDETGLSEA